MRSPGHCRRHPCKCVAVQITLAGQTVLVTGGGSGIGKGVAAAQGLFDTYVSALDNVLRELGVSDVSMARKMRTLGEALYGRMTAYEAPLRAGDDEALATHLARNVFESEDADRGRALADYALAAQATLAGQAFRDVLTAPSWPEVMGPEIRA